MKRLIVALVLLAIPDPARAQQAEVVEYYAQDAIGSLRIVFDANGIVKGRQDYTPFGRPLSTVPQMPNQGFGAQDADGETESGYFHARMFGPRTGRFSRPDPIQDGSVDPQRWNRYAYALNNPVSFIDPGGLNAAAPGSDANCSNPDFRTEFSSSCSYQDFLIWLLFHGSGGGGSNDGAIDGGGGGTDQAQDPTSVSDDNSDDPIISIIDGPTTCPPVPFKVTGIGPKQAPGRTSITFAARKDIPDGGVAIKPGNFGVGTLTKDTRAVLANVRLTADWSTAVKPNKRAPAIPTGLPTQGPYLPVDALGPKSVRDEPGNQIDVYGYGSTSQAFASTRIVMITAEIPQNTVGVQCPK